MSTHFKEYGLPDEVRLVYKAMMKSAKQVGMCGRAYGSLNIKPWDPNYPKETTNTGVNAIARGFGAWWVGSYTEETYCVFGDNWDRMQTTIFWRPSIRFTYRTYVYGEEKPVSLDEALEAARIFFAGVYPR